MSTWKLIEDLTLCECWVHTTHDPITGNKMDKQEMWSKITKAFCDVHGKDTRSSQGLQGRWKKLNASFTCWKNAISHASGNLRSGTSLADQSDNIFIYLYAFHPHQYFNLFICITPAFYNIVLSHIYRHYKHKHSTMRRTITIHSTNGNVGKLSKIAPDTKLWQPVQKLSCMA